MSLSYWLLTCQAQSMPKLLLLLLLLAPATTYAQPVSIGVKVGVPMSYATGNAGHPAPYLVGPSVEIPLQSAFAIDASVIYRRAGANFIGTSSAGGIATESRLQSRASTWEFP